MATQYTVTFVNNSQQGWDFCLYQQAPNMGPDMMTLAWFAQQVDPGNSANYTWSIDYSFVWSETGQLANGAVQFMAQGPRPADPQGNNSIAFTNNGAYTFGVPTEDPSNAGTLCIVQDGTIESNKAYVGIGMGGAGTFAVPATPHITAYFSPDPVYWCTFGTYSIGQVVSVEETTSPQQITFGTDVYHVKVTLSADNVFSVENM